MLKINNIRKSKSYSHSLLLLKGSTHRSIKSNKVYVCVNSNSQINNWPIIESKFKILLHLQKHVNEVRVWVENDSNEEIENLKFELTFDPPINKRFIRIVYLVCEDINGKLFENGTFQSPEHENNSIDSALKRISLNMLMAQTFFAQTLPNHKTFQLELDNNNFPKVHAFKLNISNIQIWSLDSYDLWKYVAKQIMSSVLGNDCFKYIAICSFTRFSLESNFTALQMNYSQLLHHLKGNTSLGGGGLALVGSACLYTWPSSLSDVVNRFTDQRLVDRNNFMDDSANRFHK